MAGFLKENQVTQNRWLPGLILFTVLMILVISGSLLFREWQNGQATVGHRQPLPALNYCTPGQLHPCFLSFNLDRDGELLVSLQILSDLPDFYLQIRHEDGVTTYQCHKVGRFATTILCSGQAVPVGEVLQFVLLSKQDDRLLAEGQFPIIGLALATPEPATTPTSIPLWERPPK